LIYAILINRFKGVNHSYPNGKASSCEQESILIGRFTGSLSLL